MGAAIFLVLFILGILLSTVGGLIGLIDAFRVSPVWGLLSFFVPFVLLIFCIKFWGSRKWAKISLITSMAGLVATLAGIPFLAGFMRQAQLDIQMGDGIVTEEPLDQVPIDQVPIDQVPLDQVPIEEAPVDQGTGEGGDPDFATPMVPAAPQLANITTSAELIQSTDPEERIRQINSRRPDPFATVPVPPPPQVTPPPPPPGSPTPAAPANTGGIPTAPTAAAPTTAPGGTTPPSPGGGAAPSPGGTAAQPSPGGGTAAQPAGPGGQPASPPGEIALAPLPSLPEPTQAQEVVVTGVMTIGSRTYAIVQSPDEPTGRYVAVGQRVAGGSVLVKRIDMRGNEPVVVLEQNGVEVSHSVGVQEEADGPAAT
ncbi:MAG: hypothetical protein ACHWZW_19335 [Spirulina sp.]